MTPNQFHRLLESIIRDGQRESLVFIVQVILEDRGLHHYRSLHRHCEHEGFGEVLERILRDAFVEAVSSYAGNGVYLSALAAR